MAEVRTESVVERLDNSMKRALEEAMGRVLPDVAFDKSALFREFRLALRRKCSTWERVQDDAVKKRCRHCREDA